MEAERKEKQEEDARKQVTKKLFSSSSDQLSHSLSVCVLFLERYQNVFALNLFQTAERVPLER